MRSESASAGSLCGGVCTSLARSIAGNCICGSSSWGVEAGRHRFGVQWRVGASILCPVHEVGAPLGAAATDRIPSPHLPTARARGRLDLARCARRLVSSWLHLPWSRPPSASPAASTPVRSSTARRRCSLPEDGLEIYRSTRRSPLARARAKACPPSPAWVKAWAWPSNTRTTPMQVPETPAGSRTEGRMPVALARAMRSAETVFAIGGDARRYGRRSNATGRNAKSLKGAVSISVLRGGAGRVCRTPSVKRCSAPLLEHATSPVRV